MADIEVIVEPSEVSTVVEVSPGLSVVALEVATGAPGRAGEPGANGSDASVTSSNITAALGYTPDSPTASRPPTSHTHTAAQITNFVEAVEAVAPPADWNSLRNKPTLGTASGHDAGDFATAAQGAKADSALQSGAPISAISGLQTALNGKQEAGSYATLDGGGKVPAGLLPSYVDDVLEYSALSVFPATGETGKIYTATDTGKIYRWSGSTYIEISPSPGSTDSVTEGSTNLYFTAARAVSALASTLASYATQAWVTAQNFLTDAPSDGSQYARKDGGWQSITTGNPFDQSLNTTDSPTFDNLTSTGTVTITDGITFPTGGSSFGDPVFSYISPYGFSFFSGLYGGDFGNPLFHDLGGAGITLGACPTGPSQTLSLGTSGIVFASPYGSGPDVFTVDQGGNITATGNITAANLPSSFFSGAYADLTGTPTLFSGSWNALSDKPTIPDAQVNSDWNATSGVAQILNKPTLFSGAYSDLSGKPTLGTAAAQNTSAFDAAGAASSAQSYAIQRVNHTGTQAASTITGLSTVATSGAYGDLSGRPSIPTTSDNLTEGSTNLYFTSARALSAVTWSTLTGKPTFATLATSGLASDLTGTIADSVLSSNVPLKNAANSFTAAQTIASGTLTASAPALNITQTWNNSGVTFTGIKANITDTASSSTSSLLDLQVGGTSYFTVYKPGAASNAGGFSFTPGTNTGTFSFDSASTSSVNFKRNTTAIFTARADSITAFNFGSAFSVGWNSDTYLNRDAANTLAQRNGTNAQTTRIYGTYTDASNGRRLDITSTTGGIFTLTATGNGTGASGNLLKLTQPILLPASSVTLATNGDLAFEATSNTTLTIRYRGSDGTTRSTALTLA